ncbi:MAG: ABC transporter [Gordonia sp.]|nr:ABC transporter [Gordonia sp. (in: high G+C Gram-positive bacteria)]
MSEYVAFLLLGLGSGAVYAALATNLVVTFRSSGVLNFASGAIALYGAYTYAFLRKGELMVIVPGLPKTVGVGDPWPFVPAIVVATGLTAVLGLLLYLVIFRQLRAAPPVGRAVASLGVMVVMTGLLLSKFGTKPVTVKPIFPKDSFGVGSTQVPTDRIYFAAAVVVIGLLLGALYKLTRFGLVTRAAAETEKGAVVSRISPDRVAALNWMISSGVAGLAGILIAPIVPLQPAAYTLFVVPALAAAILGRFTSLSLAIAGGLVIGMLQSVAQYLTGSYEWLPQTGLPELIPLLLILIVLLVVRTPLQARGTLVQRTLGRAPRPKRLVVPTVVFGAGAVVGLIVLQGGWRAGLIISFVMAIIALSLVVVTGYAGQVSLAQLSLAGAGAFALGPIADDWGVPFPIAPLLCGVVAMVIGVVMGLPAIRVKGLNVAVVTLALAVVLEALWFRNTDIVGTTGTIEIDPPTLFGVDIGIGSGQDYPRLVFGVWVLVVLVVVALSVARLRLSKLGAAMLAVRANERSAAAAGIDVVRTKLVAFAIAAFIAGVGGALLGYTQTSVGFQSFDVILGLGLFGTVYIAGVTSVSGGIVGGVIATGGLMWVAMDRWLSMSGDTYQIITGAALVMTVIFHPEGLVGPNPISAAIKHRLRPPRPHDDGQSVAHTAAPGAAGDLRRAPVVGDERGPVALSIRNLEVDYGGVVALSDVSFDVLAGTITGVIGPNGAGKTTLIDAITGFADASGTISVNGVGVQGLSPHKRVRAGLTRTFQSLELYDDMSVAENIAVGLHSPSTTAGQDQVDDDAALAGVYKLLGLESVKDTAAEDLSHGERQLVSIARALVGRPSVLLLDEPAAGLDSDESVWLGQRLARVRDSGVTIILVDHDMGLVLSLCDEVQVLDFGVLIASGPATIVRDDPKVTAAYLGNTPDDTPEPSLQQPGVPTTSAGLSTTGAAGTTGGSQHV